MKKRLTALAAERAIAQSAISSQCRHPVASPATTRFGRGVAITLADASSSSRAVAAPAVTSHSRIVLSEEPEASRPSGSTHRAATRPECPSRRAVSAPGDVRGRVAGLRPPAGRAARGRRGAVAALSGSGLGQEG